MQDALIYVDDVSVILGQTNSVTATAVGPLGEPVTATATAPVSPGTPSLGITKAASTAGPLRVGDTFDYTVTVTNTGLTNSTGLVVSDPLPAGLAPNGDVIADKPAYSINTTDGFDAEVYNGGVNWAGDWVETGDDGAADNGRIRVDTGKGVPPGSLRFAPDNNPYSITAPGEPRGCQPRRRSSSRAAGTVSVPTSTRSRTTPSPCTSPGNSSPQSTPRPRPLHAQPTTASTFATVGPLTIPALGLVNGAQLEFRATGDKEAWIDNILISATYPAATVTAGPAPTLTSAGGPYVLPPAWVGDVHHSRRGHGCARRRLPVQQRGAGHQRPADDPGRCRSVHAVPGTGLRGHEDGDRDVGERIRTR